MGSIVCDALQAAEQLKDNGMDIGVINVHTVKPLDQESLEQLSRSYHTWISVEEHNVIGGLGSALAEVIVDKHLDVRLEKIGLTDTFAKGHGTYDDIKRVNGLAVENMVQTCMKVGENI
jgi:transketolase